MNERFRLKTPEELKAQSDAAAEALGENLIASSEEPGAVMELTEEQLAEKYPLKFTLYKEILQRQRKGEEPFPSEKQKEVALRAVQIINNVEDFTSRLANGDPDIKLYEHQKQVFESLQAHLEAGHERGWIKLPTGSGKTAIFCSLISACKRKSLIVVPRTKLVEQTKEEMEKFAPEVSCSRFDGTVKDLDGDTVITTYQSLGTLAEQAREQGIEFDIIIADEAHRGITQLAQDNLEAVGKGKTIIGVTATPDFDQDERRVGNHFGEQIYEMSLNTAIEAGILSGVRCMFLRTDIDISHVKVTAKEEYNEKELDKALNIEKRNLAVIELLKQPEIRSRKTAVFCLSIGHIDRMTKLAEEAGLRAGGVHSKMTKDQKDQVFKDYEDGVINVILSDKMLTEGWDDPATEVGVNMKPTKSVVDAEQRGGRILRKWDDGGKTYGLIIDVVDIGEEESSNRGITMVDILGGVAELPAVSRTGSTDDGGGPGGPRWMPDKFEFDGITLVSDLEQVLELNKNTAAKEKEVQQELLTIEEFQAALAENGWDAVNLANLSPQEILNTKLKEGSFAGNSIRLLVKRYYEVVLKEPVTTVLVRHILGGLRDILGDEFRLNFIKKRVHSPITVEAFLRQAAFNPPDELLEMDFSLYFGALNVKGSEIYEALRDHLREKGYDLDINDRNSLVDATNRLVVKARRPDILDNIEHGQEVHRLSQSGELQKAFLADPTLAWKTFDDMKGGSITLPGGQAFQTKQVFDYYGVDDNETYRQWVDDLLGEGAVEAVLQKSKEQLKRILESDPDKAAFVPLASFVDVPIINEGGVTLNGREYMKLHDISLLHSEYEKMMNDLMGPGFCKEFWPLHKERMRMIVRDSLQAAGKTELKQAKAEDIRDIPLVSEYISPDTGLSTINDLIGTWHGTYSLHRGGYSESWTDRLIEPQDVGFNQEVHNQNQPMRINAIYRDFFEYIKKPVPPILRRNPI